MTGTPTASPPPSSGRARWLFLGAALLLGVGSFALYAAAPQPDTKAAAGEEARAIAVEVVQLEPRSLERTTRLSGVIEARRRVELLSETAGRVILLGAEELDPVEADQLLVEVDPLLADVAVERAEAAVARSESQLSLAQSEGERYEKLAGRDAASASRRDQARSAEKVADANLREMRAILLEARDSLGKKSIRAPFAGVLADFPVEEGEFLRPGDRVAELLDLSGARIELGVTDREIVDLTAGAPVQVAIEAYPGEPFRGEIVRVGAAADLQTRKFPIEIELANPDQRILPGMIARVSLDLGGGDPVRAIPRDAVVDQFGVRFAYVVARAEGRDVAQRRRVEVREIPFLPGSLELVDGVADGERIVTTGVGELRDGALVRVGAAAPAPSDVAPSGSAPSKTAPSTTARSAEGLGDDS